MEISLLGRFLVLASGARLGEDNIPGRLPELDHLRERPVAVICRTNRMSIQAGELLRRAGFRRVQLVTDGMLAWRQQDHA